MAVVEFGQQPGLGEAPAPLNRPLRKSQQFGNLAVLKADKEPEFDNFGLGRVLRRKPVQRLVNMEQPSRVMSVGKIDFVQGNALSPAAMAELEFATGIINENAAHALGCGAEEVCSVLPRLIGRVHQAQPGLMDQSCGLQGVASRLASHSVRREFAQLIVNQREQFLCCLGIALVNADQYLGYFANELSLLDRPSLWKLGNVRPDSEASEARCSSIRLSKLAAADSR